MAYVRWRLEDPSDPNPTTNNYQFEINPNEMSSPYPTRSVTTMGTTAVDGNVLMWEGMRQPAVMTFGGTLLSADQLNELTKWVYQKQGRMFLWDHFGRRMLVVLHKLEAVPVRTAGRFYMRHTWSIECTVISISQPLITEWSDA